MASAGDITTRLLMKTDGFETDTARAERSLRRLQKEADATSRAFKASFAGNLLSDLFQKLGSVIVKLPGQLIDSADALNDVSDATGASIENLSALESVAKRNGQSLESVTSVLVKFNKALQDADGKNEVSRALQAIGLDAAQLRREDPAEALRQTAVALARFADDGDKARLIQILFGKSVKEAGQFLKDLGVEQKLNATLTTQQSEAAEKFNKELFALQTNISEVGRRLATDFVIGANEYIAKMKQMESLSAGFIDFHKWLAARAAEKLSFGIFQFKKDNQLDSSSTNDAILARRARDALANRPSVGAVAPKTAGAKSERESEAQRYLESLEKQIEKTKELTVFEQAVADITKGRIKGLTKDLEAYILAAAGELDINKQLKADEKERAEIAELMFRNSQRLGAAAQAEAAALEESIQSYREQTEELGLSSEALYALERARVSSALAIKEEALATEMLRGICNEYTDALERQIEALREQQNLLGARQARERYVEDIKRIIEEANALRDAVKNPFEDAFVDFISGSKSAGEAFRTFANQVIANLLRIQAQKLALSIFGDQNGGGFDWSSLFRSSGANIAGGATSGGITGGGAGVPLGKMGPSATKIVIENHGAEIEQRSEAVDGGLQTRLVVRMVQGEIARQSRPGGAIRQGLRQQPPKRG